MLLNNSIKLIRRIISVIYLCILKIFFGKSIKLPRLFRSFIASGSLINIIQGDLIFHGRFYSRRFLTININGGRVVIGDGVFFNQNVSINCQKLITIGENTILGENVKIYDHNHRFRSSEPILQQGFKSKRVNIGSNVWIGTNTVILSGVSIGNNTVVSAGSVVKKDIPDNSLFVDGNFEMIVRDKL